MKRKKIIGIHEFDRGKKPWLVTLECGHDELRKTKPIGPSVNGCSDCEGLKEKEIKEVRWEVQGGEGFKDGLAKIVSNDDTRLVPHMAVVLCDGHDAQLMASAPELLSALRKILNTFSMTYVGGGGPRERNIQARKLARAAIRKATGGEA